MRHSLCVFSVTNYNHDRSATPKAHVWHCQTLTGRKKIITASANTVFAHSGCFIHGTSVPLGISLKLCNPNKNYSIKLSKINGQMFAAFISFLFFYFLFCSSPNITPKQCITSTANQRMDWDLFAFLIWNINTASQPCEMQKCRLGHMLAPEARSQLDKQTRTP